MSRIAENLEWSLRYFATDPAGSLLTFEEMYAAQREQLLSETARLFADPDETSGAIGMVAFLLRKHELLPLLQSPKTPRESRLRLAQLGLKVDADLDYPLADLILECTDARVRQDLLTVLGQNRVRPEVFGRLRPLIHDRDPHLQSKMAMLMVQVDPEGSWVSDGLADADPRVRANIVEALWSQRSDFALSIFRRASLDPHHRVAANGVYGLYLLGHSAALPAIREMLLSHDSLSRRAGLWLVERTRDPRYLSLLGKLIGKVEPEARARCLRVFQAAKSRKNKARETGELRLVATLWSPGLIRLSAFDGDRRLKDLHPFDLVLQGHGQMIDRFELTARPADRPRSIILLTGECPDWRNSWRPALAPLAAPPSPADQFGFLPFQAIAPAAESITSFHLLGVKVAAARDQASAPGGPAKDAEVTWCGKSLTTLRRAFDQRPTASPPLPEALRLALAADPGGTRQTHLVILTQGDLPGLETFDPPPGTSLDVISDTPSHAVEAACHQLGGRLHLVASAAQAALLLAGLHCGWQSDYDLAFPPEVRLEAIELICERGFGTKLFDDDLEDGMVGVQGLEPRASSV